METEKVNRRNDDGSKDIPLADHIREMKREAATPDLPFRDG